MRENFDVLLTPRDKIYKEKIARCAAVKDVRYDIL